VKKLIGLGLLLLVACQRKVVVSSPAPVPGATTTVGQIGGATPAEAVGMMLAAGKAEDLQAVGAVWGDQEGLTRDKWSRQEFEMRAYYVVKCLRNDRYSILSEAPAAAGGRRVLTVQINKGALTETTNFRLVMGKNGRWLVENADLAPLTKICQLA
jgi:hypothetical protein